MPQEAGHPGRRVLATGVPIDCVNAADPGSPPFGTERAPAALRDAGLPGAAGAADAGDLDVRLVGRDRDAGTGVLGWPSVLATTRALRSLIRDQIDEGTVPFLVGGCCTLLPGALGAPLIGRGELALLGPRDRDEAADYGCVLPEQAGLDRELGPEVLRERGLAAAGQAARDQLTAAAGRYWVHLDVDVLDERAFPATDYPDARRPVAGRARRADPAAAGRARAGRGVAGLLQPPEGLRWPRRA